MGANQSWLSWMIAVLAVILLGMVTPRLPQSVVKIGFVLPNPSRRSSLRTSGVILKRRG